MYYAVTAVLRPHAAGEFRRKLADGTIAAQKPDGQEIVESMHRATVDEQNVVRWSEVCYCDTPLAHERQTVYDHYFDDLTTRQIDQYETYPGRPLLEYLDELAAS